eukprot:scaffold19923_cov107-Isochrysis_galbana.AAC.2
MGSIASSARAHAADGVVVGSVEQHLHVAEDRAECGGGHAGGRQRSVEARVQEHQPPLVLALGRKKGKRRRGPGSHSTHPISRRASRLDPSRDRLQRRRGPVALLAGGIPGRSTAASRCLPCRPGQEERRRPDGRRGHRLVWSHRQAAAAQTCGRGARRAVRGVHADRRLVSAARIGEGSGGGGRSDEAPVVAQPRVTLRLQPGAQVEESVCGPADGLLSRGRLLLLCHLLDRRAGRLCLSQHLRDKRYRLRGRDRRLAVAAPAARAHARRSPGDKSTVAGGGAARADVPDVASFAGGDASLGELDRSLRGARAGGRAGVLSLMHRSSSERSCSTDRRDLVRRGSSAAGETSMSRRAASECRNV